MFYVSTWKNLKYIVTVSHLCKFKMFSPGNIYWRTFGSPSFRVRNVACALPRLHWDTGTNRIPHATAVPHRMGTLCVHERYQTQETSVPIQINLEVNRENTRTHNLKWGRRNRRWQIILLPCLQCAVCPEMLDVTVRNESINVCRWTLKCKKRASWKDSDVLLGIWHHTCF